MAGGDTLRDTEATHFGFREVPLAEKQALVDDVFATVARRYDLMNDLMSGGLHRLWKDAMVNTLAAPKSSRPFRLVDVGGGTGDISFRVVEGAGPAVTSTVCDINSEMLKVGEERARERGIDDRVSFVEGNAEELPFGNSEFDGYTIAFAIRNVPRIDRALAEAYRVLKPGSRFLCLEFSNVDVPGLDKIYDFYSFHLIPRIGRMVVGEAQPYEYLVESIRRFPNRAVFSDMIAAAGFERVSATPMTGGVVALHSAWKI
ncbi:bifunctional demethylmenaquinone methyltransferase/2-methoxy-6-polyprenyl-1,4-benzoquinol methylase UbiE [Blastochloris sulfoviridis]|uniref:Ubiquinone/menaquinone biosynthesis C-methyltransferase UbiE n=1 Tax=Blastochloris sulfoviridis TaxID=50712 RepID=A0A5M6I121_9HYPH|nr:bifunctional demethylmenaquinone methyltransferase/2-methoxy-6-polyprenyl-1,4-benzoquinol methylase UbiE [Blastochloris sulfoviridis]KAA5601866.1 bifunctional demethylmenaquinone methyltransferase/2-methoxy-6-polyprenyl-1,4-benzoquinol methylase UbiE [Blastochloris sulfoviridis]